MVRTILNSLMLSAFCVFCCMIVSSLISGTERCQSCNGRLIASPIYVNEFGHYATFAECEDCGLLSTATHKRP